MQSPYYVCTDERVVHFVDVFDLFQDYSALLTRLHGPHLESSFTAFVERLEAESELLIFVFADEQLIATAQGSLAQLHGRRYVYINDVVVHDDYEGQGYGRIVISTLQLSAYARWARDGEALRLYLSNSPNKENAGFYEKLGFRARTKENNDPTVVWVKDMQGV